MADLGLITYNAQAGFDFLVKNGVTPASRSVGDIEVALEKVCHANGRSNEME